jgi:hypothetical protein
MIKKIFFLFYKILLCLDKIFKISTKRSLLICFKDFIQDDSYKYINILGNNIKLFSPNQLIDWRIETFYTKEPETLQ